jgi:hypothetical protein
MSDRGRTFAAFYLVRALRKVNFPQTILPVSCKAAKTWGPEALKMGDSGLPHTASTASLGSLWDQFWGRCDWRNLTILASVCALGQSCAGSSASFLGWAASNATAPWETPQSIGDCSLWVGSLIWWLTELELSLFCLVFSHSKFSRS